MDIMALVDKGGILMFPIAGASVVAFMLFFERLWSLRESRVVADELHRRIVGLLHSKRYDSAEAACAADPSSLARLALIALKYRDRNREGIKNLMEEAGALEARKMSRFVEGVGTVAAVSPLLGLLGTVTGMIRVFKEVADAAEPHIGQLAGGIWEALITTGAGLTVAIPSYLAYRWLQGLVEERLYVLQERSVEILDALDEGQIEDGTS